MVKGQQGIGIFPSFVVEPNDHEIVSVPLDHKVKLTYGVAYLKEDERAELHDLIYLMREVILEEQSDMSI